MERPAGFEGRSVDDVRGAELTKLLEDRQRQSDARQQFLAGDPTGRIAVLPEFGDRGEIVKGHRAWMIINPADGKMPAMTEEGQRRTPWRDPGRTGRATSSFSNAGFDSHVDFSLTDRCITRGYPGSMLPAIYGDSYQIVQAPGYVAIRYEMVHETRIIPLDSRPHVLEEHASRHGRRAGPLGGRLARRRDDELPRSQRLSEREPERAEDHRTLHPHGA